MKVTVVIPVFNERETLRPLVERITEHIGPHEHRILFVDDGSTDGSVEALRRLHEQFPAVDVIRFRRNFGKSAALAAGFAAAEGDAVITMDGDLQDDPKEIPRFIEKIEEGWDVVVGWKANRQDPWHKTFPSRIYNRIVSRLFKLDLHDVNCGFKALRAEVVRNIPVYGEMHRLIPVLAADLGYRITEIRVDHRPREHGASKYGIERFSRGAIDVLSVLFLSRCQHSPGHFFAKAGFWTVAVGLLGICAALAARFCFDAIFMGLMLGFAGVGCVGAGILLIALGLVAELLVRRLPPTAPASLVAEELRH